MFFSIKQTQQYLSSIEVIYRSFTSSLTEESVVINVVLELHIHVHVLLVVKILVHLLPVDLLNVKSPPFTVAVASPLVGFACVPHL